MAIARMQPELRELMLRHPPVSWRIEGIDLLCWAQGEHSPAELRARLDLLSDLIDAIPDKVWADRGVI